MHKKMSLFCDLMGFFVLLSLAGTVNVWAADANNNEELLKKAEWRDTSTFNFYNKKAKVRVAFNAYRVSKNTVCDIVSIRYQDRSATILEEAVPERRCKTEAHQVVGDNFYTDASNYREIEPNKFELSIVGDLAESSPSVNQIACIESQKNAVQRFLDRMKPNKFINHMSVVFVDNYNTSPRANDGWFESDLRSDDEGEVFVTAKIDSNGACWIVDENRISSRINEIVDDLKLKVEESRRKDEEKRRIEKQTAKEKFEAALEGYRQQ